MSRTRYRAAMAGSVGLILLAASGPAMATGAGADSQESAGQCSAGTGWRLEVEPEHGGTKIDWRLRSDPGSGSWAYSISAAGDVRQGVATADEDGRVEVEHLVRSLAAGEVVQATAESQVTGESCSGVLTVATTGGDDSSDGSDDSSDDNGGGSSDDRGDDSSDGNGGGSSDDRGDDSSDDSRGDDSAHRSSGREDCSDAARIGLVVRGGATRLKLKVVLDSEGPGERWSYRVKRAKRTVAKGVATTRGESGRFAVKKRVRSKGNNVFRVSARNLSDTETCHVGVHH